jgi:ribosomal protein L37AE/L43A
LQNGLREIISRYEIEHSYTWRYFQYHFAKADFYWRGVQNLYWDYFNESWREITRDQFSKADVDPEQQIYTYPVNFYQAIGESIIAVLMQRLPQVRFVAEDFQRDFDVSAAKVANDAKEYIDRLNKARLMYARSLYMSYTHGIQGAHTRYEVNGEKYGHTDEPQFAVTQSKIPAHYLCAQCGSATPARDLMLSAGMCQNCGAPLNETMYSPERMVQVPTQTGIVKIPNGQVTTTLYDGLQLRLPYYANDRSQCPFIGVIQEVDESALKDAHPKKHKEIVGGYYAGTQAEGEDRYLRLARMQPHGAYYGTGAEITNLATYRRYWLRPYTYYRLNDDLRAGLKKYFPEGCRVEFANENFLAAYNEGMDKHWAIGQTLPGVGIYTPAIGQSVLPMQDSYNYDEAIKREYIEFRSFEPQFADARMVNLDALNRRKMRAREMVGVYVPAGKTINDAVSVQRRGKGPDAVWRHADDVFAMSRFLAGAPPTITGGSEKVLKPMTFAADRDLALGRKGIHWNMTYDYWNEIGGQQVVIFRDNQQEDIRYQVKKGDKLEKVVVSMRALKQGRFKVYPEMDESFPTLIEQQRETFMELLKMGDEKMNEILSHPRNIEYARQMFGMKIYVPGEHDRHKQAVEIEMLMQAEPLPEQIPNKETGEPEQVDMPSIMPNFYADDHGIQAEECSNWIVSPAGMEAERSNPAGFANVNAHLRIHEEMMQQRIAMQMAKAGEVAGGPE